MSKLAHRLAALCITAAVVFTGLAAQAERALPKGYQRVQFVKLTGGAVVQTDVHVEETMSLYFKFAMNYKSAYGAAITDYLGENNRLTCVRYNNTTKTKYLVSFMNKTNGGGTSMDLTSADGQIIEGKMAAGTASINNKTATLKATSYGTPLENTNCLLLKDTGAGSTFYYFTVSNTVTDAESGESTTTLVRDYIPCVELATGKAGFWNGEAFQTSETGTVTAGDYVIDPATDCMVSGYPAEYATDESPVFYGVIAGLEGQTFTAPATMPFNNGTRTCTGYKLYEYQNGTYVEIASGDATTYTFTAADAAASNRKLVWQWQTAETYTAANYVQSGLVSQWDGFDNQGTGQLVSEASTWKALKGGVDFALNGDAAFSEKGLVLPGNAASYALASSEDEGFSTAFPSGAKTVEIVVNPKTVAGYALCGSMCGLYFNGTTSVIPTVKPGTTKGVTYAKAAANVTCTYSTLYTAANVSSALRLNGTTAATGTTGYSNVSPTDVCLGGNGAGGFNGSVYSLRIYNRTLSEDEAAFNAAVDNIRFKGADPDEEIHALGIRLRQDGLFEYLLSVDAGDDGKVKVTANGETTAESELAELWLTNGAPVKVEYVPTTAGDWRYLEGCPDDVAYVSPTVTTFTMPAKKYSVEEIPFAYQDDNLVTCDGSVRATNTYEGRTVYIFTNVTFKTIPVFFKRSIRLEDMLVVAGGGGATACGATSNHSGGGGGGGVIYQSINGSVAGGSGMLVTVGDGGGAGAAGRDSVLKVGSTTLTAKGGGSGANAGGAGGSGGGGGRYDGGAAVAGQGYPGGGWVNISSDGAGGGGAEQIGGNVRAFNGKFAGGIGGNGRWDMITGENHCYGSGGGGQCQAGSAAYDEETMLPIFAYGGAESGGRGGYTKAIAGITWSNEWNNAHNGVDGLGGGGGAGTTAGLGGSGTVILGFTAFNDSRTLEFDDFEAYPILDGAATPEPEVRCGGVTLVKGTDYDFFYENNDKPGKAYLVIVGKGNYAGLTRRHLFVVNATHFVKPVATGSGDGSDWDNAMSFADAIAGLASGTYEIWCQAGTYEISAGITIPNYTAIRGGFAGDQNDTLKKDPNGAKTIFDGGDTATRLFTSGYNCNAAYFASRPIAFEDCAFTRCKGNAIYSTGKATPFTFTRCDFLDNTPPTTSVNKDAFVFYCASASSAPVVFKDCHFENNTNNTTTSKSLMYLNVVKLTMDGCTFVKNGAPLSKTLSTYGNSTSSRLIHLDGCSGEAKISNCDFRGNFFVRYTTAMQGLYICSSKTTIENCRFVGNSFYVSTQYSRYDAIVRAEPGSASCPVAIRNCTFAYNALDANVDGNSCISSNGAGPLTVENCIFWNNIQNTANSYKRDFHGSNATLAYSIFAELDTSGACVSVQPEESCFTGDPLFVTTNSIEDYLRTDLGAGRVGLDPAKIDDILAIDVHLRSTEGYRKNGDATWYQTENELSQAIDAGDPAADYSNEPGRNGERLNIGGYGNTEEASQTPYANPALGEPAVTFEGPYTQPTVTLTMGGDGQFNVTVTVFASADGVNWTSSANFSMANGDSVSWLVPEYFPEGGKVYLKTSYDFQGATIEDESYKPTDVEGTLPPWAGKGGDPAKVVHVRADATGRGDGTSWTDACTDMSQAMRLLTSTRNEMWIAGTAAMAEADNTTIWTRNYLMFFRGGFTGIENTPEQRTDKLATSTITGCGVNDGLKFSSASAKVFENIVFEGGSIYGLKLENGRAAFTNCVFRGNGTSPTLTGYQGRVLNASGVSPLQMQGCTFAENLVTNQWSTPGGQQGHLFSFANTDVYLDDCLFVSNGLKKSMLVWTNTFAKAGGDNGSCVGFLIGFAGDYKSFVANNTRFIANTTIGGGNYGGGNISFENTGTRVAFTNCLFLANEYVKNPLGTGGAGDPGDFIYFGQGQNCQSTSPIIDVINCTFAFNSSYRANGGAALTVKAAGSPVTRVKNSIFLANRTSNGCGWRQLEITTGTAEVDYCCFDSTNGFHGVGYDAVTNAANHNLVAVDPMTYSTVTDFTNALSKAYSIHFDWDHPEKFMNFNMHLRGPGGYIDETTLEKVKGGKPVSPCVDAGDPASPYRRETKPNGRKVNMGYYGNTPYQTQTLSGGVFSVR